MEISNELRCQVANCKKRGGKKCGCDVGCSADEEIKLLEFDLDFKQNRLNQEKRQVENIRKHLETQRCTVREDWKKPKKPEGDYRLVAFCDDGWLLMWASETEIENGIHISDSENWPFVEEYAYDEDWHALGIETEHV